MLRLPMHQCDSLHDCAVAPSPIVRTYRPDPPSKRRLSNMTSTKTGPPPKPLVAPRPTPRPEARSAGTAERAGRNESLGDMVRFFQTQNMPSQPPTSPQPPSHAPPQPPPSSPSDTTTALPVPISPKEPTPDLKQDSKPDPKQDLKPFHRRLLQFAQRQKKESSPRTKQEEQQRQIEALTRGGYLIPAAPPKESKVQKEAKRSKESLSLSVSRSLSKSKKDVENIGQPWLQAKVDGTKRSSETRRRLGSLDLGDFGSMVDVAVSLTSDFDDSMPPPYQPNDHAPSQSSSVIPTSSSTADPSQNITRPTSSLASTSHSYRNTSIDEQIRRPSSSAELSTRADGVSRVNINASVGVNRTELQPKPSIDSPKRTQPEQSALRNVTPSQPTLKLFPDIAPRKSSKGALTISSIPRYQTIENTIASSSSPASSSRTGPSDNVPEVPDEPKRLSDGFIDAPISKAEPECPVVPAPSVTSSAEAPSIEKAPKTSASQDETKIRPLSLSLGTLKAFPLPAPTRPLPSLPKPKCSPNTPDTNARSIRTISSGPLSPGLHSPSATLVEGQEIEPAANSPRTLDSPLAIRGSVDAGGSMADDEESLFTTSLSEHYQPTPEHCTLRGRVSSVRIPRMQELPESPSSQCDAKGSEGQPLADSPVLGHSAPAKSNGKRAALKGLQINSQISRKNIPFGLPSPPPTAALPSVPPPQHSLPVPPGRKVGQRNYTGPNVAIPASMRNIEANPTPGPYRGSTISRSNSSGSSLRHESFPETYKKGRPESRAESPLPSSDDEVFGPEIDIKHSRRDADKYHRTQPTRRGYETMEPRQMSSHTRLRYSNPARPMTPQSRSIHSLEKTSSPQSQYSQSTHRSRESQSSSLHTRAAPQMDHYLEDRVANLERQNQILQAALMAALNAGVKNPLEGLNLSPNMSPGFPHAPFAHQYSGPHASRPDSWVSSSRSSEHSGFETSSSYRDSRPNVKQLDNMIEDIESGWMSDKSSLSGTRIARKR